MEEVDEEGVRGGEGKETLGGRKALLARRSRVLWMAGLLQPKTRQAVSGLFQIFD